jgi:molecular chaperone GrpE
METPVTPEEETEEVEATETKGDPKKTVRELLEVKRKLADAEEKLAAAEAREAELSDKHLRLAAEYENFRRRAAAEKTAAYTDGLEGALAKLLPILDNLERAALYQDGEKVAEGLAITAKAAAEAIASLGVETFGEIGEEFDPNLHNAIGHVENEELSENVIAEVYQKGYKKGDRVLRYAMVMVAN